MNKKTSSGSVFAPVSPPANVPVETSAQEAERLRRELVGAEIDARFREGLENGTITGDVVIVDEHGNIIGGLPDHNIFDF